MPDDGNCILITGGTGKLGRIFVGGFLELGWQVVYTFRSAAQADALVQSVDERWRVRLHGLPVDLSEPEGPAHVAALLSERGLSPTCLVNNARNRDTLVVEANGSPSRPHWFGEYLFAVVVPFNLAQALLGMPGSRLECIVNIGSMYGVIAAHPELYDDPNRESPIHYGVAKAALVHLTREMAVRYAKSRVRVNAVSFGGVEGRTSDEFNTRYGKLCPAGRMLSESDVMGPVAFLASRDNARGMTGHNLVVDGGWSIW